MAEQEKQDIVRLQAEIHAKPKGVPEFQADKATASEQDEAIEDNVLGSIEEDEEEEGEEENKEKTKEETPEGDNDAPS